MNDFTIFILSNGRPNHIKTIKTLERQGYTGSYYIVIDDEDPTKDEYMKIHGDKVITFSKDEIVKKFDIGTNKIEKKAIVFARNVCFDIAEKLGITYFLQFDDDYVEFRYSFDTKRNFTGRLVKSLDPIIEIFLNYYKNISVSTIAMAQGGDFIGGGNSMLGKSICTKRKAMNSFFCSTKRRFNFVGNINEDVNTYTSLGSKGNIFLTIGMVRLDQTPTQSNAGGMTGLYKDVGTYYKSFYSVIYSPSSVKISSMGPVDSRIHHRVAWNNTAPMILRENNKEELAS